MSNTEVRDELARVAASLRAYLEWQQETGASGIPRRPRPAGTVPETAVTATPTTSAAPPPAPPPAPSVNAHVQAPATFPPPAFAAPTFASPAATPATRSKPAPSPSVPPPVLAPPRALPIIQAEVASCVKCELSATRTNTVFSRGNPEAKLCFVGEAPGADEDAQGLPFVGRAGQLLDKMIQAMGLDPAKDVYVCNIIKCRPPDNRRPEPAEIATCIPYLHEQLATVDPRVIVAMGNTAVGALLDTKLGITKVRGQWKLYRGKTPVMPTYHPSYLLRPSAQQAEAKKQAWEDLQAVMKEMGLPKKG